MNEFIAINHFRLHLISLFVCICTTVPHKHECLPTQYLKKLVVTHWLVVTHLIMDIDSITEQAQQSQINNTMPSYTEQLKTENSQLKMLKACCRTFTEQ